MHAEKEIEEGRRKECLHDTAGKTQLISAIFLLRKNGNFVSLFSNHILLT